MQCDACGQALDELIALGDGVRSAFRAGAVSAVTTSAFVQRLAGQGVRLREYRLPPNGSVNCTVAPDDDLLVSHLEAPLDGVQRLDAVDGVVARARRRASPRGRAVRSAGGRGALPAEDRGGEAAARAHACGSRCWRWKPGAPARSGAMPSSTGRGRAERSDLRSGRQRGAEAALLGGVAVAAGAAGACRGGEDRAGRGGGLAAAGAAGARAGDASARGGGGGNVHRNLLKWGSDPADP